jgi:hypothetical protein
MTTIDVPVKTRRRRTLEERRAAADERIQAAKAILRAREEERRRLNATIAQRSKSAEKKARDHRLICIGAAFEGETKLVGVAGLERFFAELRRVKIGETTALDHALFVAQQKQNAL